jgi:hypothetical protein
MKLVLCPYGHQNAPDARFCVTCKLPIPPDPTRVDDDDGGDDPEPIPVVPVPTVVDEPEPEPVTDPDASPPADILPPTGTVCPNGHWNPPDQERWCVVCAHPLYEEPAEEVEVAPFPWSRVAIGGGVVVLLVGIVLVIGALIGEEEPPVITAISGETTTITTPPTPTTLSVDRITVTASSEQPDGANVAGNVLDGHNDTAWGHCGAGCPPEEDAAADEDGVGAFIEFDFDAPYVVVAFTIINGYDKVAEDGSDRWLQNSRIAQLTVTGDAGQSQSLSLDDVRTEQMLELTFAQPTTSIRFTIDAVYPGERWEDVTISEVRFDVLGAVS